eukprot:3806477-Pleurochrysis_carterae.AAC.3
MHKRTSGSIPSLNLFTRPPPPPLPRSTAARQYTSKIRKIANRQTQRAMQSNASNHQHAH